MMEILAGCISESFGIGTDQIGLNDPFRGGYIVNTYGNRPVPWIQIEINRDLYMSERWFDGGTLEADAGRLRDLNGMFRDALILFADRNWPAGAVTCGMAGAAWRCDTGRRGTPGTIGGRAPDSHVRGGQEGYNTERQLSAGCNLRTALSVRDRFRYAAHGGSPDKAGGRVGLYCTGRARRSWLNRLQATARFVDRAHPGLYVSRNCEVPKTSCIGPHVRTHL